LAQAAYLAQGVELILGFRTHSVGVTKASDNVCYHEPVVLDERVWRVDHCAKAEGSMVLAWSGLRRSGRVAMPYTTS
jgi:hypothetical protein